METLELSLAWTELLHGRIIADIRVQAGEFNYSEKLLGQLKKIPQKETDSAKKMKLPFQLARFDLEDFRVNMEDYSGVKRGGNFVLSDIQANVTNLNPSKEYPYSFYTAEVAVQGLSKLHLKGKVNLRTKPMEWDMDGEMRAMELTALNELLKDKLPLTFTKGKMDLYAEAKSEDGKVEGYLKPFFKDLDFMGNERDFKGVKHWGIELGGALTNFILKNVSSDSAATKIPFSFHKQMQVDKGEALEKAIEHGFDEKLSPGIENKWEIDKKR